MFNNRAKILQVCFRFLILIDKNQGKIQFEASNR